MRVFEVVDLVIGGDRPRTLDKLLGDAAQRLDFRHRQDVGEHDKPVAPVIGKGGLGQHGSSRRAILAELLAGAGEFVNPRY